MGRAAKSSLAMAPNGYNQYSPYYYGNGSYTPGIQQAPANVSRTQSNNTSNTQPDQSNYQNSYYPQHSGYPQQATYSQAHGSNYDQSSNPYTYQPQASPNTSDTSALRHLANAARLQHSTDSYAAAGSGQGTGALHQLIDHNRSNTPVARQSPLPPVSNDQQTNVNSSRRPSGAHNPGYPVDPQSQSGYLANGTQHDTNMPGNQGQVYDRPSLPQNHRGQQSTEHRTSLPPYRPSSAQNTVHQSRDRQSVQCSQQAQAHPAPAINKSSPALQTNHDDDSGQSSQVPQQTSRTPKSPQQPMTVNPSQVFNQEEFAMRQEKTRQISNLERQPSPVSGARSVAKGSDVEGAKKDQIEADMKAMIRKMQEYKSKDPGLFSQIWEQVKTGQAPAKPSPQTKPAQPESVPSPVLQQAAKALQRSPAAKSPAQTHEQSTPGPPAALPPIKPKRSYVRRKKAKIVDFESQSTLRPSESTQTQGSTPQQATATQGSGSQPRGQPPPFASQPNGTTAGKGKRQRRESDNVAPTTNTVAPPLTGTTIWPNGFEGRKIALALRQYLINAPGNSDKDVAVEEIVEMLASHPSFPDLCLLLQRRGFVIDKPACAKHLLVAAPEIQNGHVNGTTGKHMGPVGSDPYGPGLPDGHSPANQGVDARPGPPPPSNHGNHIQPNAQIFSPPPGYSLAPNPHFSNFSNGTAPVAPMSGEIKKGKSKAKAMLGETGKIVKSLSKPPTKADMAKKRSFADIVDLTALSDDEAELDKARALANLEAEELAKAQELERQKAEDHVKAQAMLPDIETEAPSLVANENRPKLNLTDVVDQLQRRNALQRSSYNPLTIARDILLATGKHPSMAPLNEHLAGLRSHFRNVDFASDLSTFKWDVVDPGGPDPNDADDEDDPMPALAQPAMQVPLSAPGSEAAAVPVAAPRRGRKRKTIGDVDSTNPPRGFEAAGPTGQMAASSPHTSIPNSRDERSANIQTQSRGNKSSSSMAANASIHVEDLANLDAGQSGTNRNVQNPGVMVNTTPRRRGRPSGSINRPKERDHEAQTMNLASGAPRSTPRPSSLRDEVTPAATSPGFAIVVPPPSADRDKPLPRRGRPPKSSPKTQQQSTPKYPTYDCRWKECPAKLHNLDILRRHALKHADEYKQGPYPCLWDVCSMRGIKAETSEEHDATFGDLTSWKNHMNGDHFAVIAKRLGDGPRATPSSDASDHYLSDSQGRKVTPIADPQHGRPDLVSLSAGRQTAKAYHVAHDNDTEEDRANALYEAHLRKRRAVGPGVLKTGATFVNDKKRQKLQVEEGDGTLKDVGSADEV